MRFLRFTKHSGGPLQWGKATAALALSTISTTTVYPPAVRPTAFIKPTGALLEESNASVPPNVIAPLAPIITSALRLLSDPKSPGKNNFPNA